MTAVQIPKGARRRYRAAPFGPVTFWRDEAGMHGVASDGRHVLVALPTQHRFPDGNRLLADGVAVTIDDRHVATLTQTTSGIMRSARVVHVLDAGSGLVPDGAFLRRRRISQVWLQTDQRTLVRPGGPVPFAFRSVRTAPDVRDDLALAFVVMWPAVEFAV
jgi:hypothetical protein